jgi:predicted LPLAT superfamily acyltransferase
MQETAKTRKLAVKKRGNKAGFWFFKLFLNCFGLSGAYALLYFVSLHYLLFDRQARVSGLCYIKRRFRGEGILRKVFRLYRLFVSQGKQLIDRFALISAKEKFDFQLVGYEKLKDVLSAGKGAFLLLTAHVGNWQIAMTALKKIEKTVYLIMRPEDNPAVAESLNISAENSSVHIISPEGYLGGVVEAMNALDKGNIVSVMGDRKYGFEATKVRFLGDIAYFPFGAFSIAASSNVPVVVLLSAKLKKNKYLVDVSNIIYPRYEGKEGKREQLNRYVQVFAGILDKYVQEYPYQCFLFHDVWAE